MTNRRAYQMLVVASLFAGAYELALTLGPGEAQEFRGLWQVWHPYFLPLLGMLTVPLVGAYALPLARRLGGRATAWGRTLWFLAVGILSYTVLGAGAVFYELTCPSWGPLACDRGYGFLPHPNWGAVGMIAFYPLVATGLASLLRALGTSVGTELRRLWFVPLVITAVVTWLLAPFELDLMIDPAQTTAGTLVDLAEAVGGIVLVSLATFAAASAGALTGGRFRRPVILQLVELVVIGAGTMITVSVSAHGQRFGTSDPSTIPYTVGFVCWVAAFLMIGAALERMLAPTAEAAGERAPELGQPDDAAAPAPDAAGAGG